MKKLSELIVNKRKVILIVFLVLAVAGGVLQGRTVINNNMTDYLPEDSQTKQGLAAMEAEFGNASTLNLMFTGLAEQEKAEIAEALSQMDFIDSVSHEPASEAYDKDGHTRYVVNSNCDAYSEEAGKLLKAVEAKYEGYDLAMGGTIIDGQKQGVDNRMILAAVALLVVVLFIMCSSWLEPVLFLVAIGIAILLNAGTNIIFPSVSQMTNSIAAILQLALSMDYSIMLIDRYRYERQQTADKEVAMKQAIADGFSSIASSSLTTIVGLLCLIFMSFTIGMDMGLVLAKGVFFSLVSILFVLPALILQFDQAIEKTKKKTPQVNMGGIAKFNYRFRYVIMAVFFAVFAVSFLLKGQAAIEFTAPSTNSDQDQINEVFPSDNTMVLLYQNEDEAQAAALIKQLEEMEEITGVTAYANTLGTGLTSAQAAEEFGMAPEAAAMFYYRYHGNEGTEKMTVETFLTFVQKAVAGNPAFSAYFDEDSMAQLGTLGLFASAESGVGKTAAEMAETLEMDTETVNQLYALYFRTFPAEGGMRLDSFLTFLAEDVAGNPVLAASLTEAQRGEMAALSTLADPAALQTEHTAEVLAAQMGMEEAQVAQLFVYASQVRGETVTAMTLPDFLTFLTEDVVTNPQLAGNWGEGELEQVIRMNAVVTGILSEDVYSAEDLAVFTGMDVTQMTQLLLYRQSVYGDVAGWTVSLREFIDFLLITVQESGDQQTGMEETQLAQLALAQRIMEAVKAGQAYTPEALCELFGMTDAGMTPAGMTPESLSLLYLYHASWENPDADGKIPVFDFVQFMDTEVKGDERFSPFVEEELSAQLDEAMAELRNGKSALVGPNLSRMMIQMNCEEESEETLVLMGKLDALFQKNLQTYGMIGNSPTSYEMQSTFTRELNFITILTAIAIFLVVALTFRSVSVPIILVMLIQCAVFMTTAVAYLQGIGTYYLALIIVQAILMGATIDYAILYTEYYRKLRLRKSVKDAVASAYKGSIMTILTSSSILIGITLVVGLVVKDPTISQVCLTISKGSFFATLLVIFVLPALLAITDRFVIGKKGYVEKQ